MLLNKANISCFNNFIWVTFRFRGGFYIKGQNHLVLTFEFSKSLPENYRKYMIIFSDSEDECLIFSSCCFKMQNILLSCQGSNKE
jgi:hypothetical protein